MADNFEQGNRNIPSSAHQTKRLSRRRIILAGGVGMAGIAAAGMVTPEPSVAQQPQETPSNQQARTGKLNGSGAIAGLFAAATTATAETRKPAREQAMDGTEIITQSIKEYYGAARYDQKMRAGFKTLCSTIKT